MAELQATLQGNWELEPDLEVWVHIDRKPKLVVLSGRLDATTGPSVRDLLQKLVAGPEDHLLVDLSRASFGEDVDQLLLGQAGGAGAPATRVVLLRDSRGVG